MAHRLHHPADQLIGEHDVAGRMSIVDRQLALDEAHRLQRPARRIREELIEPWIVRRLVVPEEGLEQDRRGDEIS